MKYHEKDFAYLLGLYRERAGLTQQELAYKISVHRNTIASWEARGPLPKSRGQVLRLADELFLTTEERKAFVLAADFSTERWPTEVWTVPQQRDMFFTGRGDVFQSLRELLVPGSVTALTQAISGLGGIGKTHTAVEYAYRFHQYYEAVLWLQADSWEVLTLACMKLADELGLPEQKEADQIVAEVQRWLRKHRHWLLILDNVENPQEILPKFVPTGHQGSVLVTTRIHDVEPLAQTQALSTMSEQEGVLFLLRRTKKIASNTELEQASIEQYHEARQIWQLMDGLPLALDQAGAYILETGCSFPNYQEQYIVRRAELLHWRGKRFIGHEASTATTFSLAFERVEALNPVAADILRVCSLLYSEAIPEELFEEEAEQLGPRLATERNHLNLAIGVLQEYSLVLRNSDIRSLTIHRLVQAVLIEGMDQETRHLWAERTVRAVNLAFPDVTDVKLWEQCERYLPHALVCATWIEQEDITLSEAAGLLNAAGYYLDDHAQYERAEPLYQRALAIYEKQLGPWHRDIADTLNMLGFNYKTRGKYEQAEQYYQRALDIRERVLGEHPSTAITLNNLAALYQAQGKYEQAQTLVMRALTIREQQLGPQDPEMAPGLNTLALLYQAQGKYEQAELLFVRALAINEKAYGPEHPLTATGLINLALLHVAQGKYEQVEPLFVRALTIDEKAYGPEHPEVATDLFNLAALYQDQGKYEQAESLLGRVLSIYEQWLGPQHPYTASALNELATLYQAKGKYEQAEQYYQRALDIRERVLGEHPSTAITLNNLAALYQAQGKYEQAQTLVVRALAIVEKQLGPEHPDTVTIRKHYDALVENMQRKGKGSTNTPQP